jgi:uncharacterized protein (DUF1499 family)
MKTTRFEQICQTKPCSLVAADSKINIQNAAVEVMVKLGKLFAAGEIQQAELFTERDKLLTAAGLAFAEPATEKADDEGSATPDPHPRKRPAACMNRPATASTSATAAAVAVEPVKKAVKPLEPVEPLKAKPAATSVAARSKKPRKASSKSSAKVGFWDKAEMHLPSDSDDFDV